VCSGYKIFSPHMGFAWCRSESIDRLPTFREDFIPDVTPDKLEAGTYAYENVAGMDAVIDYLERLGTRMGAAPGTSRRSVLRVAMEAIADYERRLSKELVAAVVAVDGASVHGVTGGSFTDRVPTVLFTIAGVAPPAIAEELASRGIGARSGHMYSPRLMRRLNLMPGGAVRVSLVHYNTLAEVQRFRDVLSDLVSHLRSTRREGAGISTAG
jgi:selenocysteine lyase/cysteine desulfurase